MTNRPLSPQDLEILSAYIDNQLGDREVKRLEVRLAENAGLRATLEDLKRTRLMVRSLPKVRAPRNFTLSAQMVGEIRRPQRSFWQLSSSWGMVSALAVMILMVTLMGDLMGVFTPVPNVAGSYASEAMSLDAEMEAMSETAPEEAPQVALLAPLETPSPGEQGVEETVAVTEADPAVPEQEETASAEVARVMETPVTKEGAPLDASAENPDAALSAGESYPLFTPIWVRIIEATLIILAVSAVALAIFWQRKG